LTQLYENVIEDYKIIVQDTGTARREKSHIQHRQGLPFIELIIVGASKLLRNPEGRPRVERHRSDQIRSDQILREKN
jgi:hypothetical protein